MMVFKTAVQALFADPNISVEIWHRDGEGGFTRARGILRRPDEITEFGSARLLSDTTRMDVRVEDIPDPRPQEQILIGDETFLIQGEPARDRDRLIWTIDLAPA
ncbi:head-tail joining protein [Pseudogemmobacter sp. W21_MBD1_M6]|uniref:head-tail joining protein n=1 Tax=Pseudogemmobacter sp. W21_MBD1_M6 TaxID=3240271 RepID=UPI003F95AE87